MQNKNKSNTNCLNNSPCIPVLKFARVPLFEEGSHQRRRQLLSGLCSMVSTWRHFWCQQQLGWRKLRCLIRVPVLTPSLVGRPIRTVGLYHVRSNSWVTIALQVASICRILEGLWTCHASFEIDSIDESTMSVTQRRIRAQELCTNTGLHERVNHEIKTLMFIWKRCYYAAALSAFFQWSHHRGPSAILCSDTAKERRTITKTVFSHSHNSPWSSLTFIDRI